MSQSLSPQVLHKVTLPKWGLNMTEGTVIAWLVDEGASIEAGADLLELETDKTASVVESPASGILLRHIAQGGDVLPVGSLLGVIGAASVPDNVVDAFVASFAPEPDD